MAMQKNITTPEGLVSTYHKINIQKIDWINKVGMVEVWSWIDSNARQSNPNNPIMETEIYWAGDNFIFTADGNNVKAAYDSLAVARLNDEGVDTNPFTGATEI